MYCNTAFSSLDASIPTGNEHHQHDMLESAGAHWCVRYSRQDRYLNPLMPPHSRRRKAKPLAKAHGKARGRFIARIEGDLRD